MRNCFDCGGTFKPNVQARIKCAHVPCSVWTHKDCFKRNHTSKNNTWYCTDHIEEIHVPLRRASTPKSQESEDAIASLSNAFNSLNISSMLLNANEFNQMKAKNLRYSFPIVHNNKAKVPDSNKTFNIPLVNNLNKEHSNKIIEIDDKDDENNPFDNFNCDICDGSFEKGTKGLCCVSCRSTFHYLCLNESERQTTKSGKFYCQHCLQDMIRLDMLKERQRREMKRNYRDDRQTKNTVTKAKPIEPARADVNNDKFPTNKQTVEPADKATTENRRKDDKISKNTKHCIRFDISSSDSTFDPSSSSSSDEKRHKKSSKKSKRLKKKRYASSSSTTSEYTSSSEDDEDSEVSNTKVMVGLYKLTQKERMKSKFEKLPIVDAVDSKWTVFFDLFKESKKLFSHSENVVRIQNSIKCREILDIGGINLFNPLTYFETLKLINKRVCRSVNLLQKETDEIIKLKKLKNDTESKKVLEFINKVVNYSHIVQKHGKKKHLIDDRVISHISNIMPNGMMHGWHKFKAKLDDHDKTVSITHMAKYLSKQVSYIQSKMSAEDIDPWKESFSARSQKRPEFAIKRSYQHSTDTVENRETTNSRNFCWLHGTKNHSAFSCNKLWSISGKEVSDLAKKNNICTFCGSKKHENCQNSNNLRCRIEGCNFKHHMIFCYKRKPKNAQLNFHNSESRKAYTHKNGEKSKKIEKKSTFNHRANTDKSDNNTETRTEEDTMINVPKSNFYIHQPPDQIKVDSNFFQVHDSLFPHSTINNHIRGVSVTYNQNSRDPMSRKTSSNLLGVIVINFTASNEMAAFLLDSGSSVSIIEQSFADKLELNGVWQPLKLNWSGQVSRVDYGSRIIKAEVQGLSRDANSEVIYLRTMQSLDMGKQTFDVNEMCFHYPYLRELRLVNYSKITGVIGTDNLWSFDQYKVFKPSNWKSNMPYGIRCPLGDYVVGNAHQLKDVYEFYLARQNTKLVAHNYHHTIVLSDEEMTEWSLMETEILGLDYKMPKTHENESYEDKLAIEILDKYVKRSENGINYEAPLLWKDENISLPTEMSYKVALRRFLIVEKNSIRNGRFNECIDQVQNLLNKGYAEIVPYDEIIKPYGRTFYIPTFFIQPKNKRTRFIWDAATKVEGKSLNDYLLAGPNLYTNYLKIIFNMREGQFLVKGDIQEMFHRIVMRPEDRDSLRFLFRESPGEKIKILRMKVMIFGSKSSPTTSQYVKNIVARNFIDEHPLACDIITDSTYVDDVIFSLNSFEEAQDVIYQIRNILKSGGFHLVKLKSNDDNVLNKIRTNCTNDELANEKLFSKESDEKLLGYNIDFANDELKIALILEKISDKILDCIEKPTKKQVLQFIMSIYDPVGFIEFLQSKFKLIYHWIVKEKYDWTQVLDDKYFDIWKKCVLWLKQAVNIKAPRLYSHSLRNAKIIQLIGFGDAGTEILCAVIYMRLLNDSRDYLDHAFICSKSYIVPLKQSRTIPDLELDIACKLAHLMQKVANFHRIKFDEFIYFTDNIAVKEWIVNEARNPKIYVKNRLEKIHKITKKEEWRWIPTDMQPADFGTKISSMPDLNFANNWFNPVIFALPERNWPQEPNKDQIDTQRCANTTESLCHDSIFDFNTVSSLDPLITKAQNYLKIKYHTKISIMSRELQELEELKTRAQKMEANDRIISLKDSIQNIRDSISKRDFKYTQIENSFIVMAQKESFEKEYFDLLNKRPLKSSNPLKRLLPYIDNDGLLRARTRITDSEENRKKFGINRINPIILPRLHRVTTLIILKYHKALAHHNEKVLILNLMEKYHINKIKRTVNNVIKNECFVCRISKARPDIPLMGDIPSYRLAFNMPAFTFVIIDLLGPISVKISKFSLAKRYVLVYSCLTTRAIHLELIESLEAQATLRALQNTFNLRGVPKRICSDNGTNFVGGHKILTENHDTWNRELLKSGMIIEPIEWDFSPPRAPHMNGAVERMVGLVKKALKQIKQFMNDKHSHYDDYGLRAILCEVINMLNSRPLEILPFENDKDGFLTPNHFIIGRQNAQSVPHYEKEPKLLTQHWEDIKMISNILWNKWLKAFLPTLLQREKWTDYSRPLAVGDIVVTIDPSIANSWRMGIVEKVTVGSQNQVRQVTVRLGKNKIMEKASQKSRNQVLRDYYNEYVTVVTRPAVAVARINLETHN